MTTELAGSADLVGRFTADDGLMLVAYTGSNITGSRVGCSAVTKCALCAGKSFSMFTLLDRALSVATGIHVGWASVTAIICVK